MKILVGLGNPGDEYAGTRHNVGFMVADEVVRRAGGGAGRRAGSSLLTPIRIAGAEVLVARPRTFMNRSGVAVRDLLRETGSEASEMLVVCDDLHLDFGTLRLRGSGSHGGHNGLRSVIDVIGTREFARLRIGVGPADPGVPHADFVLAPFRRSERARLDEVIGAGAECAEAALAEGLEAAMNRYNSRRARPEGASAQG